VGDRLHRFFPDEKACPCFPPLAELCPDHARLPTSETARLASPPVRRPTLTRDTIDAVSKSTAPPWSPCPRLLPPTLPHGVLSCGRLPPLACVETLSQYNTHLSRQPFRRYSMSLSTLSTIRMRLSHQKGLFFPHLGLDLVSDSRTQFHL